MENDARKARIIRGLQKFMALAGGRRGESGRQNIVQAGVQAAAVKAQRMAVSTDAREPATKRQKVQDAVGKAQKLAWITAERERETKRRKVHNKYGHLYR